MTAPQAKTGVEVERLIGEALAAGPTAGPWTAHFEEAYFVRGPDLGRLTMAQNLKGLHGLGGRRSGDESAANIKLIAACNPENIRAVLALLAAKQEEVDKMRADLFPLQEFMDSVFGEFPDHGDIDGFDLEHIAEACGLLKKEATITPCGEHCGCAQSGIVDGTETQCYRVQPVMRRARIAVAKRAALSPSQQGEQP